MNQTIELMKQHRSIRKYTDEPIKKDVLDEIIKAGQCASTSSYVQAYSVIRVNDIGSRSQIYEWTGEQTNVLNCAEFLVFCADLNKIKSACKETFDGGYTEWMLIATVDVALMSQNVLLAAESLGIGGVYVGAVRNKPHEICRLLQLPKHVLPMFGMCLGYPAQSPILRPRMPLNLVLHEEKYHDIDKESMAKYNEDVKSYYMERTSGKINHTWDEQMMSKSKQELRPHMKPFLEAIGFMNK